MEKNQEYNQNVKQLVFRPGPTFCLVGSGSTPVANVISSRCRQAINIYLRNKETQQSLQFIVNIKCNFIKAACIRHITVSYVTTSITHAG